MKTKVEITMTEKEAEEIRAGFEGDSAGLVDAVVDQLGLKVGAGGWFWRVTRPGGAVKLVGNLVPAGGSVVG